MQEEAEDAYSGHLQDQGACERKWPVAERIHPSPVMGRQLVATSKGVHMTDLRERGHFVEDRSKEQKLQQAIGEKETILMINQLRHEACSGAIDDLAHVVSADCMLDCLTKTSAKSDNLVKAVLIGELPNVDKQPPFRELMKDEAKVRLQTEKRKKK